MKNDLQTFSILDKNTYGYCAYINHKTSLVTNEKKSEEQNLLQNLGKMRDILRIYNITDMHPDNFICSIYKEKLMLIPIDIEAYGSTDCFQLFFEEEYRNNKKYNSYYEGVFTTVDAKKIFDGLQKQETAYNSNRLDELYNKAQKRLIVVGSGSYYHYKNDYIDNIFNDCKLNEIVDNCYKETIVNLNANFPGITFNQSEEEIKKNIHHEFE